VGRYIALLILHKILKLTPTGAVMRYLEFMEGASLVLCSLATFLWMAIGSLSRTTESEVLAQRVIAAICLSSAVLLFSLHYSGGEIWGSSKIARPFAVIAIMMALASVMNIKGKDVQGEVNPHKIMKKNNDQ
tara:strand:+ start:946 stop:1341 length:396 start_codon:yes stop_codon:yes gene_type:complete